MNFCGSIFIAFHKFYKLSAVSKINPGRVTLMLTFESLVAGENKIAVVGLGYVGLPLAVHLATHFEVVGFDLKTERIQ